MSSKSTKSNGDALTSVNGKKPPKSKTKPKKAKKELTGEEVAAQNFVDHNGASAVLKVLPPKKRLWDAINVVCDRLSNGVEYCESASDLVADLRRRDLITRRETQRLNRKYKLGLGL